MFNNKIIKLIFFVLFFIVFAAGKSNAQNITISQSVQNKTIEFGNAKMKLLLDYNNKANISSFNLNEQQVIQGDSGIYSAVKIGSVTYSSLQLKDQPKINISDNIITLSNIVYDNSSNAIDETWKFIVSNDNIQFIIQRKIADNITAEKIALPVFTFKDTIQWNGAFTDFGGLAWFYLFNQKPETYGVHASASRFWNSTTGNGLLLSVKSAGNNIVTDYTRTSTSKLACTIAVAPGEFTYRFDSGTYRRRFLRDTTDVWAPTKLTADTTTDTITLAWYDYAKASDRGDLKGINGVEVSNVLNTIARIGVIDKDHFGGNSWHTPYGPICLHEQYIAQLGLGINDSNYLKGYKDCLDFYRDNAVRDDGHVWPRWAYTNEDAMPNQFTDKGFYEAQWGYLIDANPDFVSNVSDLYNMNGDLNWVRTQQTTCEKALDWIIKRDSNNNGLVEMMNDNHTEKKSSDWIDIIWASYENAFVNAKLYHALTLWCEIEKQLGSNEKANYYKQFAEQLKTSFNKSVKDGGFWDDKKQCYIHWRDKDGSIHGNNLVTPVNFMAIAYGICDDKQRIKIILDEIETQIEKEHLFFWPICMFTYAQGEGNDWQFPFPNYENGDIFLSWGSVAVKAYTMYKPELAVKYVKNVLAQYAKDGLAFQRYGRAKQDGLGDDILSGNSLAIVGLYQSIYGINPLYNRFYLDPNITKELSGTTLKYNYRDKQLLIGLNTNNYSVADDHFKIICQNDFGFYNSNDTLFYFNSNDDAASLQIATQQDLIVDIKNWTSENMQWQQIVSGKNEIVYHINNLQAETNYTIYINGKKFQQLKTNSENSISFIDHQPTSKMIEVRKD